MTPPSPPIDVLLLTEKPLWPLDQGFRLRGQNMALALARKGFKVAIACMTGGDEDAPPGLGPMCLPWPAPDPHATSCLLARWDGVIGGPLRRKLARFQGVEPARLAGAIRLVDQYRPRAVLGMGQHSPMMLRALDSRKTRRIWYAADELVRFQLSCLRRDGPSAWPDRLLKLGLYAAIETLFVRGLDGAIGVSPADTRLLHTLAGAWSTITIRNGVDLDYFQPAHRLVMPRSLAFWGRLDFEPNIDAVCWFAQYTWPRIADRFSSATWTIMGKNPSPRVRALSQIPGIRLLGEVDDIRPHAQAAGVAILPMRCGGGIKNKLLEAAAMGLPIVASPRAVAGLDLPADQAVLSICREPEQWIDQIGRLWSDAAAAQAMRRSGRAWVERNHGWPAAADALADWLDLTAPTAFAQPERDAA